MESTLFNVSVSYLDGTDPICIFHLAAITVVASDSVSLPLFSLGGDGDSAKISIFFFSTTTRTVISVQQKRTNQNGSTLGRGS